MKRPYMSFLPLSLIRIAVGVVGCWHEGTLTTTETVKEFSPNADYIVNIWDLKHILFVIYFGWTTIKYSKNVAY